MLLHEKLKEYQIILASHSPRRQQLLKDSGFIFDVLVPKDIEEIYSSNLIREEIPVYLAELKAEAFSTLSNPKTIIITADTIVYLNNKVLGKPVDYNDAVAMLQSLSGTMHEVITGVCLFSVEKKKTFYAESKVFFRHLTQEEIEYYIKEFKPYDKAGAYGVQEWIGYTAIEHIEGSYFNVMGLPIQKLYLELQEFIKY